MQDDKIEVRKMFEKLPKKVQSYILEEHKAKYEFDNMFGVGNNVLEYNMYRTICSEYNNHDRYFKYTQLMEELKQSLSEAEREQDNEKRKRMVVNLKQRIESCKRSLAIHERHADERHDSRVLSMEKHIARRGNTNRYSIKKHAAECRYAKEDNKLDELKNSTCAKHMNKDKYYTTFAQYDYMMKDGEHYIVMNRHREDIALNVENAVRPLTMKAAELLVNLSKFKSEEYNWVRWPNVYEARDMHLVGLNSYMLRKTDDVDTSIFTLKDYDRNQILESQIACLKKQIEDWCYKHGKNIPTASTISKYPDGVQKLYFERKSIRKQMVKDPITMLIVSPELMSVARCMVIEN